MITMISQKAWIDENFLCRPQNGRFIDSNNSLMLWGCEPPKVAHFSVAFTARFLYLNETRLNALKFKNMLIHQSLLSMYQVIIQILEPQRLKLVLTCVAERPLHAGRTGAGEARDCIVARPAVAGARCTFIRVHVTHSSCHAKCNRLDPDRCVLLV